MINNEEKKFIKAYEAIPKSLIEKKVEQLKNDLVNSASEDFQASQKFIRELIRWLEVIKIYKTFKPRRKNKKFEV